MVYTYVACSLFGLYILWVLFTAVMRLQEMYRAGMLVFRANPLLWTLAFVTLAFGGILDIAVNWFIFSFVLLEPPKEFLTTTRLCRWYETAPTSWRGKVAKWFGDVFLNPVDPSGRHVK